MDIHQLIDKYFDGTTTVDEETTLRKILASDEYQGEVIDEARAVMGFFAARRRKKKKNTGISMGPTVIRAACTAAVIICAAFACRQALNTDDTYAEINGIKVDQSQAMAQMQNDLHLFGEVYDEMNQQIADDLASMNEIFKSEPTKNR